MTSENNRRPDGLDAYFDAARGHPRPSDDLVARVLADAAAVQAAPADRPAPRPARPGFWEAIGGWVAISGLAVASAAGVAIGVSLPSMIDVGTSGTFTAILEGQQAVGFAGFDAAFFGTEGGLAE